MCKLWSPPKEWLADCPRDNDTYLEPNIAWNKSLGTRWSQMRKMLTGDFFSLDIRKSRVISNIKFDTQGDRERFPEKYQLEIMETPESAWVVVGEYETLDIQFHKPRKLIQLRLTIVEPMLEPLSFEGKPPAWSIYGILLTEVRLFGKWWRKVIK